MWKMCRALEFTASLENAKLVYMRKLRGGGRAPVLISGDTNACWSERQIRLILHILWLSFKACVFCCKVDGNLSR